MLRKDSQTCTSGFVTFKKEKEKELFTFRLFLFPKKKTGPSCPKAGWRYPQDKSLSIGSFFNISHLLILLFIFFT